MASSDDEAETIPTNVLDYEFTSDKDEAISFAKLPVEWKNEGTPDRGPRQIFLGGRTDNGLLKIFRQVTAWKFDLSCMKPELSVLSVEGHWIKLIKPRKAFQDTIRTILVTVHFLHFAKRNPKGSYKALWDHLNKTFSLFEKNPSEDDLRDHMSLINEAVKRDGALASSELVRTFLEEKPRMRNPANEDVKPPFIVDDPNENEDEDSEEKDGSGDDEQDENDCFDSVCAICDNGGDILICEGKCMRSFHATVEDGEESECESLYYTEAELEVIKNIDWYCKNCEHKQHQCFACGKLGSSDETSGAEVFCCVNGACGHFYHPECVARLLHPDDEAAAEENRKKIAAGEQFACPVHKCFVCKELEGETEELRFAICRRCPRAYHRKCLPREIAFEKDADEEKGIVQRAWTGLIPNRILIYCLNHEIHPAYQTPVRNHLKFPGPQKKRKLSVDIRKVVLKGKGFASEDGTVKRVLGKAPKGVEKVSSGFKQDKLLKKGVEKLPMHGSSKQRVVANRKSLAKSKESTTGEGSLGSKLFGAYFGTDSEPGKSSRRGTPCVEQERTQIVEPTSKRLKSSLTIDADTRKGILALMNDVSSSITLEEVKESHKAPSTHVQYSKAFAEGITLGKVEGSVQALRAALKKLDEGGSIQDAKAVCGNDLFNQVLKWKEKLKVYLAPFLHGMRYTSFGRHFTKQEKLKEIVDMLHWYTQDGDMIVDFCCGSNDFSCLMKRKLDETGKRCSFKNFDILQAKNDFNFERKDWMRVRQNELPEGSRLIMGLNPPFGVNAALANKFINKALDFKPKLLILIVPRETRRLDEKAFPYDLIWEDDQMFTGKSFYLPGSIDVNDKQIEDWNVNAPILYLWSKPDWTQKHKAIAKQCGHPGTRSKSKVEENHKEMHVPHSSGDQHNLDDPILNQDETTKPGKQKDHEQELKVTTSHQEGVRRDSRATEGRKNDDQGEHHSKATPSKSDGKRKKKRKRKSDNRVFLGDKSPSKCPVSHNRSPNVANNNTPKRHESQSQVHAGRDDHQQFERRNLPSYHQYSHTGYNENQVNDVVRSYTEPRPIMASRPTYAPSSNPDYGVRASTERWMGSPEARASSFPYNNIHAREEPNSWGQRSTPLPYIRPGFPSPYGQLNPAANSSYGTSAMQRYAPRLDELNHGRINNVVSGPPMPIHTPGSRPPFQAGALGFAPGPYGSYSQQNSSGWLNE